MADQRNTKRSLDIMVEKIKFLTGFWVDSFALLNFSLLCGWLRKAGGKECLGSMYNVFAVRHRMAALSCSLALVAQFASLCLTRIM